MLGSDPTAGIVFRSTGTGREEQKERRAVINAAPGTSEESVSLKTQLSANKAGNLATDGVFRLGISPETSQDANSECGEAEAQALHLCIPLAF